MGLREITMKMIVIRELLERLALDLCNNTFTTDLGIPKNFLLEEVNGVNRVSTSHAFHFYSNAYYFAQ